MTEELTSRVEGLEMRAAYQDATIADLDATVAAQWRRIDALSQEVARLTDRLQDLSRDTSPEPEAPPPHY